MSTQIELNEEQIEALRMLDVGYYFGLYKDITRTEEDEYQIRDAIVEILKQIEEQKN